MDISQSEEQDKIYYKLENGTILDYRVQSTKQLSLVLSCEHATNLLPHPYRWSQGDEYFRDEHWGIDIGALEFAKSLSQNMQTVLVHSNYSRLLLDVNRPLLSKTLFRLEGDNRIIELNQNMTEEEEQKRMELYYVSYYRCLRKVIKDFSPNFLLCIHSFTKLYQGEQREVEIGLLSNISDEIAELIRQDLIKKGYNAQINVPYTLKDSLGFVPDYFTSSDPSNPKGLGALSIEIRNDLLTNTPIFQQILKDFTNTLQDILIPFLQKTNNYS